MITLVLFLIAMLLVVVLSKVAPRFTGAVAVVIVLGAAILFAIGTQQNNTYKATHSTYKVQTTPMTPEVEFAAVEHYYIKFLTAAHGTDWYKKPGVNPPWNIAMRTCRNSGNTLEYCLDTGRKMGWYIDPKYLQ